MYPKHNETLYIQIASADERERDEEYKARIHDITDEGILIDVPMNVHNGRLRKLHFGDELSVKYIQEDGKTHYFITHVLGFEQDNLRLVRLHKPLPDEISSVQRRSYLRVQSKLELAVQNEFGDRFVAQTMDVGGGGVSFDTGRKDLSAGQQLTCWLLLPYQNGTREHADFKAEIVRTVALENGRQQIMLAYKAITDMERQKIIKYCFEHQLVFRDK